MVPDYHLPSTMSASFESPGTASALAEAIEKLGLPLYVKDAAGRYTHVSRAAQALFADTASPVGRSDAELLAPATAAALRAADQAALGRSGPTFSEHSLEFGGERREFAGARVPLGQGALLGVWVERSERTRLASQLSEALHQLEEQQRLNEVLRSEAESREAHGEPVRAIGRREQFDDQLRREIDLSLREHREFAVVYIDVDAAPAGSPAHDEGGRLRVFEALGRLLRSNTRAMDAPCRLEGDRFALLLSGMGLATAHARMEGLRRQCATQLVPKSGAALRFTVSMGLASFPHTAQTQAGLLQAAETALVQACQRGGNHVALASIAFGGATTI